MIVLIVLCFMASNIFEKILKIIQIVVALLEMAVRSFTGLDSHSSEDVD